MPWSHWATSITNFTRGFPVGCVSWRAVQNPNLQPALFTELGFVRVLAQATQYGFSISQACRLLQQLKRAENPKFFFIPDDHDVSHIPAWVKTAKQTTDGHLAQLAKAKGAILATLDEGIPGSFAIPGGS
jgi:hypothetical protein